jgi:ElaB/YqjD/DUF883 family membrane-anchored ribosome-binding protein
MPTQGDKTMFFTSDTNKGIDTALGAARRNLDAARELAAATGEGAKQSIDDLAQQLQDLRGSLISQARLLGDSVSRKTEANPLMAVGLAFAAGIVIAKVFSRRARPPVPADAKEP